MDRNGVDCESGYVGEGGLDRIGVDGEGGMDGDVDPISLVRVVWVVVVWMVMVVISSKVVWIVVA